MYVKKGVMGTYFCQYPANVLLSQNVTVRGISGTGSLRIGAAFFVSIHSYLIFLNFIVRWIVFCKVTRPATLFVFLLKPYCENVMKDHYHDYVYYDCDLSYNRANGMNQVRHFICQLHHGATTHLSSSKK